MKEINSQTFFSITIFNDRKLLLVEYKTPPNPGKSGWWNGKKTRPEQVGKISNPMKKFKPSILQVGIH
ncbi:MAG: hypothetical protein HUU57_04790 [Bdellovibrio sp.]|nr:hypothetical protein [Bdellovibrio sp.]